MDVSLGWLDFIYSFEQVRHRKNWKQDGKRCSLILNSETYMFCIFRREIKPKKLSNDIVRSVDVIRSFFLLETGIGSIHWTHFFLDVKPWEQTMRVL